MGGLGPGGLDSDLSSPFERDCYLEVPRFESQTTNSNQQLVEPG